MKIRTGNKLSIPVSILLLVASQTSVVHAADDYYSSQGYAQPGYPAMTQQPQNVQGYGVPGYSNPGYNQRPYGGRRDYGRDSGVSPWGGNGPGFNGPWDSGRGGSSMLEPPSSATWTKRTFKRKRLPPQAVTALRVMSYCLGPECAE